MEQAFLLGTVAIAIALTTAGVVNGLRCLSTLPKHILILLGGAISAMFLIWLSIEPTHVEQLEVWIHACISTAQGFIQVIKFIWKMKR